MRKLLYLSNDFCTDAVEYASRANAILGIRDSGKTYTATMIAEQLLDHGIPFFAFDPIGRWRFLRMPRSGDQGRGFPVVVAGGAAPDIELTPKNAPTIIRAALKTGVSVVLDLYSIGLSKQSWRDIVRGSIETILYEGEGHGQRHVFLEEAAEFIPQRVRDGRTYAEVEKLARMGGNVGVGVTLINQRAEEVNKAVLELCDNLLLHRQRGKNSLISLHKWLDAGNVKPPKAVVSSLADLPTGQCWAWLRGEKPIRLVVRRKRSFDPDRRAPELRRGRADASSTQDTAQEAIDLIKAAMAGKKVLRAVTVKVEGGRPLTFTPSKSWGECEVTKDEADALRRENEQLRMRIAAALQMQDNQSEKVQEMPKKPAQYAPQEGDYYGGVVEAVIAHIKQNAPAMIALARSVPSIDVTIHRKKIEATDETLSGRVTVLLAEGFFGSHKKGMEVSAELKKRGHETAPPNVYKACDQLAKLGFLFKEEAGYLAVPGMEVNIIQRVMGEP